MFTCLAVYLVFFSFDSLSTSHTCIQEPLHSLHVPLILEGIKTFFLYVCSFFFNVLESGLGKSITMKMCLTFLLP